MDTKRLYITVEEKEEFKALIKQYGLEQLAVRSRQESKPKPQVDTEKQGRRRTRQKRR